jgi:hypothetical protein
MTAFRRVGVVVGLACWPLALAAGIVLHRWLKITLYHFPEDNT